MAVLDMIVGPGKLYRAPLATANPDESTVAFGTAWGGSWTDRGEFPDGVPITITPGFEVRKFFTEQKLAPLGTQKVKIEPVVKGSLIELTVTNAEMILDGTAATTAAAGGGQKGYSEIPFGEQSEVDYYKWGIEAYRVDSNGTKQPIRWFFHKGFFKWAGDLQHGKSVNTAVPFEIHIMHDDTQSAGSELGALQIVTAAATAT